MSKTKKERKVATTVQDQKSSSSSDSDTNEDITSKVAAAPNKINYQAGQAKVPNNSKAQKKDNSTTSTDTSESSSDAEEMNRKKRKTSYSEKAVIKPNKLWAPAVNKPVFKKTVKSSSSESDSSSDCDNNKDS